MNKRSLHPSAPPPRPWRRDALIILFLTAITLLCFWPVASCDFIKFDDHLYVTENPMVLGGVAPRGVTWAFTTFHAGNYHPLTWLSLMLDVSLLGPGPGGFHVTNLVLHVLNAVLLYLVLQRMTGSAWRAALVASIFAIHPLRVESVAWVSERKDVLSAFFGLLTLLAYTHYVCRPKLLGWRYAVVLALLTCSLLSKPMLVTLPFLLLLLDYWPLGRSRQSEQSTIPIGRLLLEKLPMLALAAGSCVVTYFAQRQAGAMAPWRHLSLTQRLVNTVMAYTCYLPAILWPRNLALLYPMSTAWQPWLVALCLALLLYITALSGWQWRYRPWLIVGWLWFLGLLAPVIGIIPVGEQFMADRYTYLPGVGLLIMAAWSLPEMVITHRQARVALGAGGLALLAVLALLTRNQLAYWQNSETLFRRTLAVTRDNYVIENNLGAYLLENQNVTPTRMEEAMHYFQEAIRHKPSFLDAHLNLGIALDQSGDPQAAAGQFSQALAIDPNSADLENELGIALSKMGETEQALPHFRRAVGLEPTNAGYLANLGRALSARGEDAGAMESFRRALTMNPASVAANAGMAELLMRQGRPRDAQAYCAMVLRLMPQAPESHLAMAAVLTALGDRDAALAELLAADALRPNDPGIHARIQGLQHATAPDREGGSGGGDAKVQTSGGGAATSP